MPSAIAPLPSTVGVLMSGGLDSSILVGRYLAEGLRVQPFYIRCGLYWESAEEAAAKQFLRAIQTPNLAPLISFDLPLADVYERHWSVTGRAVPDAETEDDAVFLPGRNALLLIKPVVWCQRHGIHALALAPLAGNPFADATDEFFDSFEAVTGHLADEKVRILRPFRTFSKRQVMEFGRHLPLEATFSCIDPQQGLHCGRCNKCAERRAAFRDAELEDRTIYASDRPSPPP